MPRKALSLEKRLLKCLAEKSKKVKGVIGMLIEPKDFMTVLAVLGGQDKNIPETIQFYEALFRRFRLNSHNIDSYMTKQEWHEWTVALSHFSDVLWKFREKFSHDSWLETNKKIYEVTFKILKNFDSEKRGHRECKHCSKLFSTILSNFTSHGEKGDIEKLKIPSVDTIKEICEKNVGLDWYYLTCGRIFEEKVNSIA